MGGLEIHVKSNGYNGLCGLFFLDRVLIFGSHVADSHKPPLLQRCRAVGKAVCDVWEDDNKGGDMSEFNRMTIVAAAEVISDFKAHSDMSVLEIQWGIQQYTSSSSKPARVASWANVATQINPNVMTESGSVPLDRALIEAAIHAPRNSREKAEWKKLIAGLRFDGFEVVEETIPDPSRRKSIFDDAPSTVTARHLRRMLPEDIPGMEFRDAENELEALLRKHDFIVALGHLEQAVAAFQRGDWAAANAQLRSFFESYLNEIAVKLGYDGKNDTKLKRDFLGALDPPFLLATYNEWHQNSQKPQYIQGLWSRMHPEGSHPGLSEEEDATFRIQITLVTARLYLRRFDQRKLLS